MSMKKAAFSVALTGTMLAGSAASASACMGVYVGKDVSETGSSYIGRSEDIGEFHTKIFEVHPAEDHEVGEVFEDAYGFSMKYTEENSHTYRYSLAKDTPEYGEGDEAYAEVGINENDVAITATVSTAYNEKAKAADPLVDTGICEISMTSIMLGQAKTAREAVEILAEIVDEHGSGECNTIMISDPNETWYMEIVSGHQYAAVKMPDDVVAAIPNMMLLGTIDVNDKENVIASDELVSLPKEKGFLEEVDGKIHVTKTYGAVDPGRGQLDRLYQGVYYLNSTKADGMSITSGENGTSLAQNEDGTFGPYDLMFSPSSKLSTDDVMDFLGYRGEGSKMNSNEDSSIYAIGNNRQAECHVLEMREGMTEGLAGVEWLAMSRAEFSVYLPFYGGLITDTWGGYKYTGGESCYDDEFNSTVDSIYCAFAELNSLADDNRDKYGTKIKEYWDKYQNELIEQQKTVDTELQALYKKDPELAQKKATELGIKIAKDAYKVADGMLKELNKFIKDGKSGVFTPSALTENVMPDYSLDRVMDDVIGVNRYETAAMLADKAGDYDTVILVNSDKTMSDGLSAAALSGKLNAPIIPVKQNKIPDEVKEQIEKAKNVYIIGGTNAISENVASQLSDKNVKRIAGKNRFETSEKIADMIGSYSHAYIVNGVTGDADAMSISSVAAKTGSPIIVTDGKTSDAAKKAGTEYTVIGGTKAVSESIENKYSADRIGGATRYETNKMIINKYYSDSEKVYVANGETLIDALSASLIAKDNGVALVNRKSDKSVLADKKVVQVGGFDYIIE
ncbi:C69 family dipeptidase [Peptacetobacter hominis]|uniref:membrane dipeptidase n=1 Tax=Peptacetobacter hominis TaxID=2743610 RepID=A0A544QVF0_9FIRM|nr:C69 family dipeptidase [Peptacetobacter hominis]TQQ84663.1 C69 family dipeptidase [Peptacetobacter hominis]